MEAKSPLNAIFEVAHVIRRQTLPRGERRLVLLTFWPQNQSLPSSAHQVCRQKPLASTHKNPHSGSAIFHNRSHKSLLLMEFRKSRKYNPSVARRNHPHSTKNQPLTGAKLPWKSQKE